MNRNDWWLLLVFAVALVAGCASSGAMSQSQALAQLGTQEKKTNLNQQLSVLGAQAAPKSSKDYQVGAEDLLDIDVYGQDDLQRTVRVNGKGEITMPLIGAVKVDGLTPQQVENRLQELYGAKFLKDPQVGVFVKEYRHQRVALTGALKNPGFYEMIGPRSLLEMIAMAGGLDDRAGDWIHLIRLQGSKKEIKEANLKDSPESFAPNSQTIIIDLKRLAKEGKPNIIIQQGDVINVPFAGLAYVLGSVNKPGSVPVKNNLTVSQAIAVAGSPVAGLAKPQASSILRVGEQGQAVTIPINLDAIIAKKEPDIALKENDVIFVPESIVRRFLLDFKQLIGGGVSLGLAAGSTL